ncbi:MAG: FtsX-like permease family protein, partial [Pseudomonadota bacterium]
LALASGREVRVAGIHADYGNPKAQVIVSEALFTQLFPQVQPSRYGLKTDDPDRLYQVLTQDLDIAPSRIIDQKGIKAFSLDVFDRTFTVTAALNVLTLGVAGFAILMSLLTTASMRLSDLAPIWALGVTRRRLAGLEIVRALGLAILTAICALPLGLALAWVLLNVINVEAFGWRLPMLFFPLSYVQLFALSVLAAAIAALWPAWRLSRSQPRELLQVFATQR